MLCAYIEVVRVANDHLNCLDEDEVGVTLVGASAPSAHYTHTCLLALGVGGGFCLNPKDRGIAGRNGILPRLLFLCNLKELFLIYSFIRFQPNS